MLHLLFAGHVLPVMCTYSSPSADNDCRSDARIVATYRKRVTYDVPSTLLSLNVLFGSKQLDISVVYC